MLFQGVMTRKLGAPEVLLLLACLELVLLNPIRTVLLLLAALAAYFMAIKTGGPFSLRDLLATVTEKERPKP